MSELDQPIGYTNSVATSLAIPNVVYRFRRTLSVVFATIGIVAPPELLDDYHNPAYVSGQMQMTLNVTSDVYVRFMAETAKTDYGPDEPFPIYLQLFIRDQSEKEYPTDQKHQLGHHYRMGHGEERVDGMAEIALEIAKFLILRRIPAASAVTRLTQDSMDAIADERARIWEQVKDKERTPTHPILQALNNLPPAIPEVTPPDWTKPTS